MVYLRLVTSEDVLENTFTKLEIANEVLDDRILGVAEEAAKLVKDLILLQDSQLGVEPAEGCFFTKD
jgi:hypothetical protein